MDPKRVRGRITVHQEEPMDRMLLTAAAILAAALVAEPLAAQALAPIALPAPQKGGGKPLMQALALRATSRAFAPDPLAAQALSNLLWAAWGVNRPDGRRTAPSAHNWQEVEVVALLPAGAYTYDASGHVLKPLVAGDLRPLGGLQDFVKDAPLTLVFVADLAKMEGSRQERELMAYADAAFISQNVYLSCASEGLATGVRAWVDRPALGKALKLREGQLVVMAQSVGYPKK
jgi:nitroreductase